MENKYKGTQTEKNLEAAFSGESQARNKYSYYASKAYVSSFTYSINLELKQYNVYAIAFNLPRIDTDFDLHAKRKSKLKKGKNPMVIADKIYKKMNSKKGIMNIGLSTKLMNLFSHLLPKSLISKCIGNRLK